MYNHLVDIKLVLAILAGKVLALILKLTGSGATAAPGLYALKIDPNLVKKLASKLKNGSVIISGTNGKTTTARLASEILSTKYRIIHNRQGSNLLRGIASTIIRRSSITGDLNYDLGVWEVDEATLPLAIENLSPKKIVLLNLFRDQLDRYGEVDSLRENWIKYMAKLSKKTELILNSDDPGISFLSKFTKAKTVFFGVSDPQINLPTIDHAADVTYCLNCGTKLVYKSLFSAHLGHYFCPNCDLKRPTPHVVASGLKFDKDFSTSASLTINHSPLTLNYSLPGLYNVYNILAAAAISSTFNISAPIIKEKITNFSTAFGRFQSVQIGKKSAVIFLIKNPTGANEVLRILSTQNKLNLLVILNDKIADGRDVSWIWDTNWEILKNKTDYVSASGIRAWDIATRLKYAEFKLSKKNIYMGNHIPHKYRNKEVSYSITDSVEKLNNNNTLIILPTYTALLSVQKTLSKLGGAEKWHEN